MTQPEREHKTNHSLVAIKLPFPLAASSGPDCSVSELGRSEMEKILENQQTIQLSRHPAISLSKKKAGRPMYLVKTTQYLNKQTNEVVECIEESEQILQMYDYTRMCDFYIHREQQDQLTIEQMKQMLRKKILKGQSQQLDDYQFVAKPIEFLKGFNLSLNNSDMLVNKLKGMKKQFKSKQISFHDPTPSPPEAIPAYVANLKIFQTIQGYLQKRPCWLRNVLEYQLRIDGFKGQYTTNELKNILKFVCFTYRDGPWKHVFCRFGYNPTQKKESTLYQILMVKIKKKEVEDYDEMMSEENDVYDPTFREMPTKYMRIYQLCDIEDKRVEELIKSTAVLSDECNKETGWFSRAQFNELQRIAKSIREQRSRH